MEWVPNYIFIFCGISNTVNPEEFIIIDYNINNSQRKWETEHPSLVLLFHIWD